MKHSWIQAAIDVEDMDLAKRIAEMAVKHGAEWIEVGTPLIYEFGIDSIRQIRSVVKDTPIVVDYKSYIPALCVKQGALAGANYIMVQATYSDSLVKQAVKLAEEAGIDVIFDIFCLKPTDLVERCKELEALGGKYIFTRHFSNYKGERFDTLETLYGQTNMKIGVTDDNFETAQQAMKKADWVVFGTALRDGDEEACQTWIDALHASR